MIPSTIQTLVVLLVGSRGGSEAQEDEVALSTDTFARANMYAMSPSESPRHNVLASARHSELTVVSRI